MNVNKFYLKQKQGRGLEKNKSQRDSFSAKQCCKLLFSKVIKDQIFDADEPNHEGRGSHSEPEETKEKTTVFN